jgi:hypothetical protein
MTTIYVSKNGDNANDGLTLATAKRTMFDAGANQGAYELASNGDTILFNDGIYSGSEIETTAGAGYLLTSKGLTLNSINPFKATLASTVTTAVVRVSGAFAGLTLSFGEINLDGDGVVPNYGVWFAPTSGTAGLSLGSIIVKQAAIHSVYCAQANTVQVNITCDNPELHAVRSGINCPTLGTNSTVDLTKPNCIITNKVVSAGCIFIKATGVGCTANVLEPVISVNHASAMAAQADFGVQIMNIDNALIYKPIINAYTEATVNGTINAAVIDCDIGTLTAHRGRILGGILNLDTNGGIGAVIGHDTTGAGDDLCNYGIIQSVEVNGGSKFEANDGHAIMQGYCQNGNSIDNRVRNVGIGVLLKATTNGKASGNKIKKANLSFLQMKGCTDSEINGNYVYMDDAVGAGLVCNANGVTSSSGCTANGNNFIVEKEATGKFIAISTGEGVTVHQSSYIVKDDAVLPSTLATVGASNYTTVAAYIAAQETDAKSLNSLPDEIAGRKHLEGLFIDNNDGTYGKS